MFSIDYRVHWPAVLQSLLKLTFSVCRNKVLSMMVEFIESSRDIINF